MFPHSNSRSKHERLTCRAGDLIINKPETILYCENHWCSKQFTTTFNKKQHEKTCKQKVTPTCEICGKEFKRKEHLMNHLPTQDKYKCPKCKTLYKRKDYFEKHVLEYAKNVLVVSVFKVYKCSRHFRKQHKYDEHVEECCVGDDVNDEAMETDYNYEMKIDNDKYGSLFEFPSMVAPTEYSIRCPDIDFTYHEDINNPNAFTDIEDLGTPGVFTNVGDLGAPNITSHVDAIDAPYIITGAGPAIITHDDQLDAPNAIAYGDEIDAPNVIPGGDDL